MADFHHLDDAMDIWLAVKARFRGNDKSKKMRKSMLKPEFSEFRELDKTEETKALLSIDSMLNWLDHEGEDVESGAAQVYGMIPGAKEDAADSATDNVAGDVDW
ncbi:hypothetical protein Tco_0208209 [Tanacetum coccineum]